jgi:hypothetical protein
MPWFVSVQLKNCHIATLVSACDHLPGAVHCLRVAREGIDRNILAAQHPVRSEMREPVMQKRHVEGPLRPGNPDQYGSIKDSLA